MNWIDNVARPRIKALFGKRDTPDNLWVKCPACGEMIFHRDMKAALNVCPKCDHHLRIGPAERLSLLFGDGEFERIATPDVPLDPLKFRDAKKYPDRLKEARAKTGSQDAFTIAAGKIEDQPAIVAIQNFEFMGGSLGMAAGEAFVTAAETAIKRRQPLVLVAASGGARMQEGILSLMQMPRTTVAVQRMRDAKLPYLVVFTDPTSGGVTASYGMLGDIQLAEPGAMIAFSGPRVIEQTIKQTLPPGFQRAEYLLEHGMIDMVVHRHRLRESVAQLLRLLADRPNVQPTALAATKKANGVDTDNPLSLPSPEAPGAKDEASP
jgi:acetyl-CoA carboxylase carboxyl transferase subunit beta